MTAKLITGGGCVEDSAYIAAAQRQADAITTEATVQAAIQAGLLLWQRYAQGAIADLRQELADRRMKMAEEVLAHAQAGWAAEAALVGEVMSTSEVGPAYSIMVAADNSVEEAWAGADGGFDAELARHGLAATTCEDARIGRGMALVQTDLLAHMMRSAEGRSIALNDRRFSRQLTVLGMGRGILQAAETMGRLGAGREVVRNAIIGTINSALSLWGYQDTRWRSGGGWAANGSEAPRVVPGGGQPAYQLPNTPAERNINISVPAQRPVADFGDFAP